MLQYWRFFDRTEIALLYPEWGRGEEAAAAGSGGLEAAARFGVDVRAPDFDRHPLFRLSIHKR